MSAPSGRLGKVLVTRQSAHTFHRRYGTVTFSLTSTASHVLSPLCFLPIAPVASAFLGCRCNCARGQWRKQQFSAVTAVATAVVGFIVFPSPHIGLQVALEKRARSLRSRPAGNHALGPGPRRERVRGKILSLPFLCQLELSFVAVFFYRCRLQPHFQNTRPRTIKKKR